MGSPVDRIKDIGPQPQSFDIERVAGGETELSISSLIGVVGCKGILVIRDVIFSRVHILGAGRYRPRCRGRA